MSAAETAYWRTYWAAVVLACDLTTCEGLLRGLPVPRHRLMGGVLIAIDEEPDGPPIVLTEELGLRIELALFPGWWAAGRPKPGGAS